MGGENKNASIRKKILFIRGNTFTRENQPRERKTSGLETLTKTKCEAKICKLKKQRQCLKALPAKIIHNLTTQLYARENMVREFNNKHFAKLQFFVPHKKKKHHFTIPFPFSFVLAQQRWFCFRRRPHQPTTQTHLQASHPVPPRLRAVPNLSCKNKKKSNAKY